MKALLLIAFLVTYLAALFAAGRRLAAIAEALRRERMAPDDYAPAPEAPEPMEEDEDEPAR